MTHTLLTITGWSAFANAVASILGTVTIIIFLIVGGFWGPLNDAFSVAWGLTFLPLAWLLYELHKPVNGSLSLVNTIIGVAALLTFAFLQLLLVVGIVQFEQTFSTVISMMGVVGLWFLLNGLMARSGKTLPAGLIWVTVGLGITYIFSAIGFLQGNWENPLAIAGFLIIAIIAPFWSFWLGRLILSQELFAAVMGVEAIP